MSRRPHADVCTSMLCECVCGGGGVCFAVPLTLQCHSRDEVPATLSVVRCVVCACRYTYTHCIALCYARLHHVLEYV